MLLLELALRCRSSMWLIYRNALLYIRSVLMTRNGWFIASSILSEISSTVILPLGMPMDRWNNTNFHPTLSNFRLRRRTFPALFCYRSSTPMGLSHCAFSQEKELSYLRMNVLMWKVGQHFLLSKLEPNQYGWQSLFCETLSQTLQKHSFQKTYQNKFSTS